MRGADITTDVNGPVDLTDEEIRERMSGNLCRCGAYVNIVAAIRRAAGKETAQNRAAGDNPGRDNAAAANAVGDNTSEDNEWKAGASS